MLLISWTRTKVHTSPKTTWPGSPDYSRALVTMVVVVTHCVHVPQKCLSPQRSLPERFHFCLSILPILQWGPVQILFPPRSLCHWVLQSKWTFPNTESLFYHLPYILTHSVVITHACYMPTTILRIMDTVLKRARFLLYELILKWMIQSNEQK